MDDPQARRPPADDPNFFISLTEFERVLNPESEDLPLTPRVPVERAPAPDPIAATATYEAFYGLNEKPFSLSTDPRFLYHSTSHDLVAQELLTAIRHRDGIVVITGEFGAGKTTLCRVVTEELDRRTLTSVLLEPFVSVEDLIETLLVDFGVISREDLAGAPRKTPEELTAALRSFIASLASLQASAVVIIDEAQNLPIDVLRQIPALAEAGEQSHLLQVVLVGQPNLTTLLKRLELRLLNGDVAVRSRLGPLAADEIAGYVLHRLAVCGDSPRVDFADGALARIHELTGGVPRIVNLLCDRAMSRGYELSARVIDGALVDAAADDLDLAPAVPEVPGIVRVLVTAMALVTLALVGAAGALWVFRDDVARTIVQWERVPPAPSSPIRRLPVPLKPIPPPAGAERFDPASNG